MTILVDTHQFARENELNELLDIRATHEVIECRDATHCHNTPFQHLFAGWRNGHYVELTVDGHVCNVRVDDGIALVDVDYSEAEAHVRKLAG
jgi:hypothetical protein